MGWRRAPPHRRQWHSLVLIRGLSSNQAPGSKHKCIFQGNTCTVVLPPEEVLLPSDNFSITFHYCVSGKEQVSLVDPQYLPRRHGEQGPCQEQP